ncbi:hypothetical protein CAOG_009149 [Capsaspora owczarzaki ATCC 30864]|uniref:Uncharacterized protein n=2 Tax=Capsaspora owczarzaki (strain ATCC 30864) TaxID=595528 RepID=A0A0D2WXJ0_CAPO3|nr:hypothetical protein CAOG_009149 [Capsaspora owczarzaki ATCC 30864]
MQAPAPTSIEIPLRGSNEVLEIEFAELPDLGDLLGILKQEKARLRIWLVLAIQYYNQKMPEACSQLLTAASDAASTEPEYADAIQDRLSILNALGAFYLQQAVEERDRETREALLQKATSQFNRADTLDVHGTLNMVGKGMLFLLRNNYERAATQFRYVTAQNPAHIPALMGQACAAYNLKQFKEALGLYRRVLRINPTGSAAIVRYGIGVCLFKLKDLERAQLAFKRVLELVPDHLEACVALATIEFNTGVDKEASATEMLTGRSAATVANLAPAQISEQASILQQAAVASVTSGMQLLQQAYKISSEENRDNAMLLNHLSNYFFSYRELDKSANLALSALHRSDVDEIKAISCYLIGRKHHAAEDYDQAFQFYYQANRLWDSFALPQFGLGQLYIKKGDIAKAAEYLEKVLVKFPDNYEASKILGSLYVTSQYSNKRQRAQQLLHKITVAQPKDVEAWIELAQLQEQTDFAAALEAYETAARLLLEADIKIAPEILNNIATLRHKLGQLDKAQDMNAAAAADVDQQIRDEEQNEMVDAQNLRSLNGLKVTIRYNRARLLEDMNNPADAEVIYRELIQEHPTLIDCYLRLAAIAKNQGRIAAAAEWVREVFAIQPHNPDAWCFVGNMHLSRYEWNLAQNKFEMLLKNNGKTNKVDPYPLIALGNIFQQSAQPVSVPKAQMDKSYVRAAEFFTKALQEDSRNIYAANGLACVMAENGFVKEAEDVFLKVRETTSESADVWTNLGHLYSSYDYTRSVKMYTNCLRKFHNDKDLDVLMHLARVHYQFKKFDACKSVLQQAFHLHPHETVIRYHLALCEEAFAEHTFAQETLHPRDVTHAIASLQVAHKIYDNLSKYPKSSRLGFTPARAAQSASRVADMLAQSAQVMRRAEAQEAERQRKAQEHEVLRKNLMERKAADEAVRQSKIAEEHARLALIAETHRKRADEAFAEFQANASAAAAAAASKKSSRGRKADTAMDDFVDDEEDSRPKKGRRSKDSGSSDESEEDAASTPSSSQGEDGGDGETAPKASKEERKRRREARKKEKRSRDKADKKSRQKRRRDDGSLEAEPRKAAREADSSDEDKGKSSSSSSRVPKRVFKSKELISDSDDDQPSSSVFRRDEDDDQDDDANTAAAPASTATFTTKARRAVESDDE